MARRSSTLMLALGTFAGTLIVGLLLAEGVLRLLLPNRYVNDNTIIQPIGIRSPNLDYVVNRRFIDPTEPEVRLRTDARSYYLPSPRFADPEATIVFMGASTTESAAVNEELRFPTLVSLLLEQKGRRINTRNIAYSGNNLHDGLNVLLNHVVLDRPDYVVLMTGGIDAAGLSGSPPYSAEMARPLSTGDVLSWLKKRSSSVSWVVSWLRYAIAFGGGMGVRPLAVEDRSGWKAFPEEEFRQRLRGFVALARAFGIEPVLVPDAYAVFRDEHEPRGARIPARDRAAEIIREVGTTDGVVVIDLPAHLRASVPDYDEPMRVFYDGVHATDHGSRIFGEFIAAQLLERVLPARPAVDRTPSAP